MDVFVDREECERITKRVREGRKESRVSDSGDRKNGEQSFLPANSRRNR